MWILYLALLAQSSNLLDDGNKALDAKQYDRALELFSQAAAADPKDYAVHFQLALAYSLLGRDSDAIPQYKTTLDLLPGEVNGRVGRKRPFRTGIRAGLGTGFSRPGCQR